jgi:mono/diheme cytochrome c family protein
MKARFRELTVKANLKVAAMCWVAVCLAMPAFAADAGADIYKAHCAMCHSDDGSANTPAGKMFKAASFSDPAIVKIADVDRLAIVKKGKGSMPSFGDKLTDDQIKAVLAYIRTLEKK